MKRPVRGSNWVYLAVGVTVGVLLLAGFGPGGLLLPHSEGCELGASLGEYTIWTPVMMANIPDGGNASMFADGFNYAMTSGSLTVGSTPSILFGVGFGLTLSTAGIFAVYLSVNWTLYQTQNASVLSSGASPCTQPYVAEFAGQPGYCEGSGIIPIPVNSSDFVEPHIWNGTAGPNWQNSLPGCPYSTPGASVWFDTTFHSRGTGLASPTQLNLCGQNGSYPLELYLEAKVPVVMTVPYQGRSVSASGYLTWVSASPYPPGFSTASYNLPAGWLWEIAPVGPVSTPVGPQPSTLPGLVAFERLSCP